MLQPLDVVINKPLKDRVRSKYVSCLSESINSYTTGIVPLPTIGKMLTWCSDGLESIETSLIFQAFESTGISKPLEELRDKELLSQRLLSVVENYFAMVETTVDEDDNPYCDAGDIKLKKMYDGQELILEVDESI